MNSEHSDQPNVFTGGRRMEDEENSFLFLIEYLQVLMDRKFLLIVFTVLGAIIAGVFAFNTTPLFKSTATFEVQKQEIQIVSGNGLEPDIIADAEFLQTQYALLKSRNLAERVVLNLRLDKNAQFADQALNQNERVQSAINVFLNNIEVKPVGLSRVISLSFVSPDAKIAASIPNKTIETFIENNLERKYNKTEYARNFLEERLAQTKTALEEAERNLVKYADQNDILEVNETGDQTSLVGSSLIRLSDEYFDAQSERIKVEQTYVQSGPERLLEDASIVRLRNQHAELSAEYQELSGTFRPAYPAMQQLKTRIDALSAQIVTQEEAVMRSFNESIEGNVKSAIAREKILKEKVDTMKDDLQNLRNRRIDYTILRREVDTVRTQYDALLQRLKEVTISSGVGSSQISMVDRSRVEKNPFYPKMPIIYTIGLFLGLLTGVALALLLHALDNTVKSPECIKAKLKLPLIGVIPYHKDMKDSITSELRDPRSVISEAYFTARTALELSSSTGHPKSLAITSTQPAEGKSSSIIALGVSFAKLGKRVLIIDGDLRKPSFSMDNKQSKGLSGLLSTPGNLEDELVFSEEYDLHLLPSGIIPPNPAELLSSDSLKNIIEDAKELFDIVLVDSPPVLNFTDSIVLGAACDAVLLVFRHRGVKMQVAYKTIERLLSNNVKVVGALLTQFDTKGSRDNYYYAYGDAGASYGKTVDDQQSTSNRKIRLFS